MSSRRRFRCPLCGDDITHMLIRSLGWAVAINHPTTPRRCLNCGRCPYRTTMLPETTEDQS